MLKHLPWIAVLSVVLIPMLPVRADSSFSSQSTFGQSSIGEPTTFGNSQPAFGTPRTVIIQRAPSVYPDAVYEPDIVAFPHVQTVIGNPYFRRSPNVNVIVAPRARTVIVNPGSSYGASNCGTTILGSPIASPIPVNPYTGLACR